MASPSARWAVCAAALAALALLTACGSGSGHGRETMGGGMMGGGQRTMPTDSQSGTTSTAAGPSGTGEALFRSSGCGGCHTLAAAGTSGTAGPNLDQVHPSYDDVVRLVADGAGAMPAFAGSLTAAQIRAIARYVADSAR